MGKIGSKAPGNYSASFWSYNFSILLCERPNLTFPWFMDFWTRGDPYLWIWIYHVIWDLGTPEHMSSPRNTWILEPRNTCWFLWIFRIPEHMSGPRKGSQIKHAPSIMHCQHLFGKITFSKFWELQGNTCKKWKSLKIVNNKFKNIKNH